MKDTIKYAFLLFIVATVCTILVVITVNFARPILEKQEAEATSNALNNLYDNIVKYENITINTKNYDVVDNLYHVTLDNDETHYVYKITTDGKNGEIVYLLALDESGTILDIAYVSQKETPSRGDKITLDDFISQFINQKNADNVDTISGATISSSAMILSVNQAISHFEEEVK